jgi:hypothetical protein
MAEDFLWVEHRLEIVAGQSTQGSQEEDVGKRPREGQQAHEEGSEEGSGGTPQDPYKHEDPAGCGHPDAEGPDDPENAPG